MVILGISTGRDAGAALVVDGRAVAAVQQERIDRILRSSAFPSGAIDAVLDVAGLRARDVDRVVVAGGAAPPAVDRAAPAWRTGLRAAIRRSGLYTLALDGAVRRLEPDIRRCGLERAAMVGVEHEKAHAWCAYRTQAEHRALVIVLDDVADGASVTVHVGAFGQLDLHFLQSALAGPATLISRVSQALGRDDLRTLAGAAKPPGELLAQMRAEVALVGEGFVARPFRPRADPLAGRVRAAPAEAAAAALQALEEDLVAFVQAWVRRTGLETVCLAGALLDDGELAAAVAAGAGAKATVCFAPGDAGLALGAALGSAGADPALVPPDLGPGFDDTACYKALSVHGEARVPVADPQAELARLLGAGRSVAWFQGRMDLGTDRGHRALLFSAAHADRIASRTGAAPRPSPLGPPGTLQVGLAPPGGPVACTPGDAIRAWRELGIDSLILGGYRVDRADRGG
jgi:predicted NodU family carbamoyl transferase